MGRQTKITKRRGRTGKGKGRPKVERVCVSYGKDGRCEKYKIKNRR